MTLLLHVLIGLLFFRNDTCICTKLDWTRAILLSSFDGLFPTTGLVGSPVTVWRKYDCINLCWSTSDCMGFVYVSSTSVCQMVQYSWNPTTQALVQPSARYYHITDANEISCSQGWEEYLGSCYYINYSLLENWETSKSTCEGYGGHLAHINHENENEFLKQRCMALLDANDNDVNACWIGLNDLDTEGDWRWDDNDEGLTLNDWASDNPNEWLFANCGCLYHSNGYYAKWSDEPCYRSYVPICEIDLT